MRILSLLAVSLFIVASGQAATLLTTEGPVVVRNFGYQLQGVSEDRQSQVQELAVAPHDFLVMDFSIFGDEASKFLPDEVTDIQHSSVKLGGDGRRKLVAAYVSIGEASDFRSYWVPAWTTTGLARDALTANAPTWLGPTNQNFPESRKVRYWDSNWHSIIFNATGTGWLDQIVSQGFDGAYLDVVDAYFFWSEEVDSSEFRTGDPTDAADAARRMMTFIVSMSSHARQTNPSFVVIPQNGEFILNDLQFAGVMQPGDDQLREDYLNAISGIGIEDTYYRGSQDINNPLDTDQEKVAVLKRDFLTSNKPVFAIDYINEPNNVASFFDVARTDGFIPYAAPSRGLDRLAAPAPSLVGDFDNNGAIESADYALWVNHFGSELELDADANIDGIVNAADYILWRNSSASTSTGNTTFLVPEASTSTLSWISLSAGLAYVRSSKKCYASNRRSE
jgi:cysteinyl-tRNA synthetase